MEWLKEFRGKTVGLDTAPLIYFIEENPSYLPIVKPFFEAVDGGDRADHSRAQQWMDLCQWEKEVRGCVTI